MENKFAVLKINYYNYVLMSSNSFKCDTTIGDPSSSPIAGSYMCIR